MSAEPGSPADDLSLAPYAKLCAALAVVERMAGDAAVTPPDGGLAPRAMAYRRAPPIARRRFDATVQEAVAFADAGIAALLRHRSATGRDCAAAAERLAGDMRQALATMDRLVAPA